MIYGIKIHQDLFQSFKKIIFASCCIYVFMLIFGLLLLANALPSFSPFFSIKTLVSASSEGSLSATIQHNIEINSPFY